MDGAESEVLGAEGKARAWIPPKSALELGRWPGRLHILMVPPLLGALRKLKKHQPAANF